MADQLLPCPFCEGEAEFFEGVWSDNDICYVQCVDCRASTNVCDTQDEAVEKWNTRPNPWHTGTPTEEGVYVIKVSNRPYFPYILANLVNNEWLTKEIQIPIESYVAWQKIEPYRG